MQENTSRKQEIFSENQEMSDVTADARDVAEFREKLHELFPTAVGPVERRIETAATRLKLTFSTVKRIWYGEATFIRAHQKASLDQVEIEEARNEYQQLIARIARLEEALTNTDEGFHRLEINALRAVRGFLGGARDSAD